MSAAMGSVRAWTVAGAGACWLVASPAAWAGPPGPPSGGGLIFGLRPIGQHGLAEPSLRDFMWKPRDADRHFGAAPIIARFNADRGDGFVLDRAARTTLLRFDDSSEIFALQATPGPRGDLIYKNDVGQPVLRVSRLGGVTLFTERRPMGAAAWAVSPAGALRPQAPLGPNGVFSALAEASRRASRAAGRLISFNAPLITPDSETLFADAFAITSDALVRMAAGGRGRVVVQRVSEVTFLPGRSPQVVAGATRVQIVIAPELGVAGRPSSERILATLQR